MRNTIAPLFICVLVFSLGAGQVMAQETTLNIEQPPSGSLSDEQLRDIAADIRRLEANPLAPHAKEAGSNLMKWGIDSPDISVTMCANVTGGLVTSKSEHKGRLLLQFILSSAAYIIENPAHTDNDVRVNLGGFDGVINAYNTIKGKLGDSATDEFVESLIEMNEEGTLEEFVAEGLEECAEGAENTEE